MTARKPRPITRPPETITETPEVIREGGALLPTAAEFKAALERVGHTPEQAALELRGFVEAAGLRGTLAHSLTNAAEPDPDGTRTVVAPDAVLTVYEPE